MNYNNFSCRVTSVRLSPVQSEAKPKAVPKKGRKPARRRAATAMAVLTLLAGGWGSSMAHASTEDAELAILPRFVAAQDTVAFTGMTGRLSLDRPFEVTPEELDLAARVEALTVQVNALTAKTFPAVRPPDREQLSALTGVLLCAGFGVAVFRAGLLFQTDLAC